MGSVSVEADGKCFCCSVVGNALSESEVAQSCPTLRDPMDCSPAGSSSMEISRQGYWSGLPFPSPGDLPGPGIEPGSPTLQTDALPSEPPGNPVLLVSANL